MTDTTDTKTPEDPRLKELEVQLKEVELETAQAELAYLREDRVLKQHEIREKEIQVQSAELSLAGRQDDRVYTRQRVAATLEVERGIFRLERAVYEDALALTGAIQRWADEHPGQPITLYLFSPGGSVFHGFALYDTLRTLSGAGHEVTTVIRGFAGSMASVIFLAGDVRRIGAESYIHQHEGSSGIRGTTSEIKEEAAFMKKLEEKITRIYTSRTNMTAKDFKAKIRKKDWYAEATEALEFGIATVVE